MFKEKGVLTPQKRGTENRAHVWLILGVTRIYNGLYADAQKKLNFTDGKTY